MSRGLSVLRVRVQDFGFLGVGFGVQGFTGLGWRD